MRQTMKNEPDFVALKRCVRALEKSTPRMRAATIEYLWDRFVAHPKPDDGVGADTLQARAADVVKAAGKLRGILG